MTHRRSRRNTDKSTFSMSSSNFRSRRREDIDHDVAYSIKQSALRVNVTLIIDVVEDKAESLQTIRMAFTAVSDNRAVAADHHVSVMLLECGLNKWEDLIELQRVLAALKTPTERGGEPLQLQSNTIIKHSTTSDELTLCLHFDRGSVDTLWRYASSLMLRLKSCGILSKVLLPKDLTLSLPFASKVLGNHSSTNDKFQWEGKFLWSQVLLGVASGEKDEIQRVVLVPAGRDNLSKLQFPGVVALADEMLSHNVDSEKPIVIILRGIPGSGKSTLRHEIEMICRQRGVTFTACSADYFFETERGYVFDAKTLSRAHNKCKEDFKRAVNGVTSLVHDSEKSHSPPHQHIVLVDNTNTQRWEYQPYESLATTIGSQVHIVELNCPDVLTAFRMGQRNSHGVSTDKVVSMFLRWEEDPRAHSFSPHFQHSTVSANPFSDGTSDSLTYLGLFLDDDSKKKLVGQIPPIHRKKTAEHVTLFYKPNKQYLRNVELGISSSVYGVEVVQNSYGQALRVQLDERLRLQVKNKIPHITISIGSRVNAAYSNELLESSTATRRTIDPPIELKARVGVALYIDNQTIVTITSPFAVEVASCDHLRRSHNVDSLPDSSTPAYQTVFILYLREDDFDDDAKTTTKLLRRAQLIHHMGPKCSTYRLLCIQKSEDSSPFISSMLRTIRSRCLLLLNNIFDDVMVVSRSPSFEGFETTINEYFNAVHWGPVNQVTMLTTIKESLQWPLSKLEAVQGAAWSISPINLEQSDVLYDDPATLFSVLDVLGINVEEQTCSIVLRGMSTVCDAWSRVLGPQVNSKDQVLRRMDTTLLGLTTDVIELCLVLPNEIASSDIPMFQMKLARELDNAQGIRCCVGDSSATGLLFFSLCAASSYDPVFCVHMIPHANTITSGMDSNSVAQFELCEQQERSKRELGDSEVYTMLSALVRSILWSGCNTLLPSKCQASSLITFISERLVLEYCKNIAQRHEADTVPTAAEFTSGRFFFLLDGLLTDYSRKGVDEWIAGFGSSIVSLQGNKSAVVAWSQALTTILQSCMSVLASRRRILNETKKRASFAPKDLLQVLVELINASAASVRLGESSVRAVIEIPRHIEWSHVHSYALCDKLRLAAATVVPPDDNCTQFFSCGPSLVARRVDVTASSLEELRHVLVKFHAVEDAEHETKSALLGDYIIREAESGEEIPLSIESVTS